MTLNQFDVRVCEITRLDFIRKNIFLCKYLERYHLSRRRAVCMKQIRWSWYTLEVHKFGLCRVELNTSPDSHMYELKEVRSTLNLICGRVGLV